MFSNNYSIFEFLSIQRIGRKFLPGSDDELWGPVSTSPCCSSAQTGWLHGGAAHSGSDNAGSVSAGNTETAGQLTGDVADRAGHATHTWRFNACTLKNDSEK